MLKRLIAKDFALLEKVDLDFKSGLTAICGESGAGKSLITKAILFGFGVKQKVEDSTSITSVTLEITIDKALLPLLSEEFGLNLDSNEVILKHIISSDKRHKYYIDDEPVTAKAFNFISEHSLEYHGQNSQSRLTDNSFHIEIVDSFAKVENEKAKAKSLYEETRNISNKISEIDKYRGLYEREQDYLQYVVKELAEIDVKVGEEEELAGKRAQYLAISKQQVSIEKAISDIEQNAIPALLNAQRDVSRLGDNPLGEEIYNLTEQSLINANEAIDRLNQLLGNGLLSESEFEELENRLFKIRDIARKYHKQPDELPAFLEESQDKLQQLNQDLGDSSALTKKLENLKSEFEKLANNLHEKRVVAARKLEEEINSHLQYLQMENSIFQIEIEKLAMEDANSNGLDKVSFLASFNKGRIPANISKIASGGEISRLMLAIKTAMIGAGDHKLIIFDEIDTGISGQAATKVALKMQELSKVNQIIVVSHQAQIVAKADNHILAEKKIKGEKTVTEASIIDKERTKEYVARMISGDNISQHALKIAQELMGE